SRYYRIFNGHDSNSKKASWVNWKNVLAPNERGGLGVSSLYALNRGLMFKWVWRFYTQDSSLWARVIKAIHGDDGKMGVITRAGSKSCWMNIVHETNALLNKCIDLIKFMRIKLGNGQITSFWMVSAGSSSSIPADYVSAGHVLVSADRDRIC
ncbi:hypothetical protein Tco_1415871, partial [Tanacetum coccineum]